MEERLLAVKQRCLNCKRCSLCKTRTNVVFGTGSPYASVMFVGEGPGENEDLQGQPFVGKAGQLLDRFLYAIDLPREDVYIANIVKCRPPHNRDPLPEEQEACIGWLREQVKIIQPTLIVCLGRVAAQKLIDPDYRVSVDHGKIIDKGKFYMTSTLHPAALLRFPEQKEKAFGDFLAIRDFLNRNR